MKQKVQELNRENKILFGPTDTEVQKANEKKKVQSGTLLKLKLPPKPDYSRHWKEKTIGVNTNMSSDQVQQATSSKQVNAKPSKTRRKKASVLEDDLLQSEQTQNKKMASGKTMVNNKTSKTQEDGMSDVGTNRSQSGDTKDRKVTTRKRKVKKTSEAEGEGGKEKAENDQSESGETQSSKATTSKSEDKKSGRAEGVDGTDKVENDQLQSDEIQSRKVIASKRKANEEDENVDFEDDQSFLRETASGRVARPVLPAPSTPLDHMLLFPVFPNDPCTPELPNEIIKDLTWKRIPSISKVLSETQSPESKYYLDRWEKEKIEELGYAGFMLLKEGNLFFSATDKKLCEITTHVTYQTKWSVNAN